MDLERLNIDHGIAETLTFIAGDGGLPMIRVRNDAAEACISLYGGQVLTFQARDDDHGLLFLSGRAYFAQGKAIKGGCPVCWPWFGADPAGQGRAAHGFARNRMWQVESTERLAADESRIVLRLGDDEETRAIWPYPFELRLRISIGQDLGLELLSRNTGGEAFEITQALHSYFAVGAIGQVAIHGLEGCSYLDKVKGFAREEQSGPVTFDGEVDRVYQQVDADISVHDPAWARQLLIEAAGSTTTVVWNPWEEIAASMADLEDDDYWRFVCVETANAADEVIRVEPGTEYRMGAVYRLSPLPNPGH